MEERRQNAEQAAALLASASDTGSLAPGDRADPSITEVMPERIGHYAVEEEIGRGAVGVVYRGRDLRLDRIVAIKALPLAVAFDPHRRSRFEREAKLLALVDHPHISAIHAIEEDHGRLFLILEHVPGESLLQTLARGPVEVTEAIRIAEQIAGAVAAAHERGIMHRDLKPANIRIRPDGTVKVLDFGLAKVLGEPAAPATGVSAAPGAEGLDPELTAVGAVLGTLAYMSPEQVRGEVVDQRADVWAFGCVLYECLAGGRVWGEGKSSERIDRILHREPIWDDLPPTTPAPVRALLESCLRKEAGMRRRNLDEARELLRSLVTRDAQPVATVQRARLPRTFTPFVGRAAELGMLRGLVAEPGLLTIVGTGGVGKTRLALELAAGLDRTTPPVWVDLVALRDPDVELLAATLASSMEIQPRSGQSNQDSVAEALSGRETLLVLDNCEQVTGPLGELVDALLATAPRLSILATSREPLALPSERVHQLQPLLIPVPGKVWRATDLFQVDAVDLFVERARRVSVDFELTDENAAAVAQICRRLDGIPLAIELAAARVRALSVGQIAARLDDRFRLLDGTPIRVGPSHHRTLRALVDWSHDALDERAQVVFRRLATFAGGFSLEAAEAVASGDGIQESEVLDLLTALLDRSLVTVARRGQGAVRYALLETIREYGRERLSQSGELEAVRSRQLDFFTALASEAEPMLVGADQTLWLDRLDDELDNLRLVIDGCMGTAEPAERAIRLMIALEPWWRLRHLPEGRALLETLVNRTVPAVVGELRERALNQIGALTTQCYEVNTAMGLHEEALAIADALDSTAGRARSLNGLGNALARRGEFARAGELFEERLRLARALGDDELVAQSLNNLGMVRLRTGQLDRARLAYEEALELYRKLGNICGVAQSLANFAVVFLDTDPSASRALLEESLPLRRRLGDRRGVVMVLVNLASSWMPESPHKCVALLEEALPTSREESFDLATITILNNLAAADLILGHVIGARERITEGLARAARGDDALLIWNLIENMARVNLMEGDTERALLLLGGTAHQRTLHGVPRTPPDAAEHAEDLARVRRELGNGVVDAILDRGTRLTIQELTHMAHQSAAR